MIDTSDVLTAKDHVTCNKKTKRAKFVVKVKLVYSPQRLDLKTESKNPYIVLSFQRGRPYFITISQ